MTRRNCTQEKNKESCSCTYEPCPRKGICCECLRYHWEMGELPACLFPPEVERTYDRSLKKFLECYRSEV
ncbi:MAG: hypothetical protein APZ16_01190 [Candidatus Hadarchaeum yellowstonense]|jgi:hypothetical protein|uniref:Cytosolic protein n=1 Tax=Hadarchaeum yellowstonense TaxID=1776334 RepID=A0A147JTQ2_HADYE|nr:MAG: hypothetical protein APZ16_01190 [Candidatus Hadarchaeum yellowstonense]